MTEAVVNRPERNRFEISVDDEVAGFAEYVDTDAQRIFFHTEIGEKFGGRGLGSQLVGTALDETREDGLHIVPVCSYVGRFIDRHPGFEDITDPVTDDSLSKVRALKKR